MASTSLPTTRKGPTASAETSASVSESSISSLGLSSPATSNPYLPPNNASHGCCPKRSNSKRSSFSLLNRLPKDFSSLIRSHSTNTPRRRHLVQHTDYDGYSPGNMDADQTPRKENRLYSFLHRSRSRSRSKGGRSTSIDVQHSAADYIIPLPSGLTGQSSAPDSGFEVRDLLPPDPSPSKPHAIIPSRPLSTATSTTHSTIGPLIPVATQSRSRGRTRYGRFPASSPVPNPQPPDEGLSEPEPESEFNPYNAIDDNPPITATDLKDRTPTRKKLHAFLGIPLPNPRKSIVAFASRPNSPEPHLTTTSRPSTPSRNRKSWLPQRLFQTPRLTTEDLPQSPPLSPSVAGREVHFNLPTSNPTPSRLEASSSKSRIPMPPSPKKLQPPSSPRATSSRTPKASTAASATQPNPPSRIPQPVFTPRPSAHNTLHSSKSADPPAPVTTKAAISRPKLPTSKTTHIPSRPTSRSSRPSSKGNERVTATVEGSRENGNAREMQKHRTNESTGSRFGRWSPKLFGRRDLSQERGREKEFAIKSLPPAHRRSTTVAKTETTKEVEKEGEKRAGAQEVKRTKSTSGQMTASIVRAKHGSFDFENPAWGLGLAKMTTSRNHSENRNLPLLPRKSTTPNSSRPLTPQDSNGGSENSHSTTHTGKSGKSLDMTGRNNEVVSRAALSSVGTGLTKSKDRAGRLVSINAHGHGSFAFEPPVPVLKTVNPKQADEGGGGFKRTGKGRSLDLGLGLSWAPSNVREEALLVPSFSRSNSMGRNGKEERGKQAKSRVGNAVSETFRGVLGEDGFSTFKRYVRRFDAQVIPFDGPTGIIARVQQLLEQYAHGLNERDKMDLMDSFIRLVLQNA